MLRKLRKVVHNYKYKKRWNASLEGRKKGHLHEISEACKESNLVLTEQPGEIEWIKKWSRLTPNLSVEFYRFYSLFIGNDSNILPDDVFHAIIDPIINDKISLPAYLNKNLYEKIVSPEVFPVCVLRNMNGDFLDRDYKDLQMTESLFEKIILKNEKLIQQGRFIVKPALETGRGKGVHLFCYKEGKWISDDNKEMSLLYLEREYGRDFIIQECIEPSAFVRQFNPISYSTFRIFTYRSVIDGAIHFLGGYLRVGNVGSFKDNLGGGGFAIPILDEGWLAPFASDESRNRYESVNGVDIKNHHCQIPNFDRIIDLAFFAAKANPMNRVLAFDILLDNNNNPHIIEINLRAQTIMTMQTTYKTFFGEYTDEIIEYCENKLKRGYYPVYPSYLRKY